METVVSIDAVQRNFRLLELSPEILSSISLNNASLHLKSELTTSSSRTQYDPGAVLCTVDQTFEIRQVQSSNILYILHPSQHEVENRADLSAIAQCHGLLELIPKRSDVVQHLRSKVPVYDARYASEKSKDGVTITDVIVDSPFSVTEIHNGLRELCAFEFCGFCWVPTAKDMKDIWLAFMNAMTVEGISIDKELDIHHADSLILEEGYSASIFKAVLGRVSHGDDHNDRASIDPGKCVTWLGSILLETDGENSVQKETFVSRWRDHLPEAWRPNVNLDILKDQYIEVEGNRIAPKPRVHPSVPPNATAKPASTSRSKWHERFKSSK